MNNPYLLIGDCHTLFFVNYYMKKNFDIYKYPDLNAQEVKFINTDRFSNGIYEIKNNNQKVAFLSQYNGALAYNFTYEDKIKFNEYKKYENINVVAWLGFSDIERHLPQKLNEEDVVVSYLDRLKSFFSSKNITVLTPLPQTFLDTEKKPEDYDKDDFIYLNSQTFGFEERYSIYKKFNHFLKIHSGYRQINFINLEAVLGFDKIPKSYFGDGTHLREEYSDLIVKYIEYKFNN